MICSEGYVLVGEKIWSLVGHLSPKDKTQLEERLRRVAGPSSPDRGETAAPQQVTRLQTGIPRSGSPAPGATSRIGGIPRPASPSVAPSSRLARPTSPASQGTRSASPVPSGIARPGSHLPTSPTPATRGRGLGPSRLGLPRSRANNIQSHVPRPSQDEYDIPSNGILHEQLPPEDEVPAPRSANGGPEDITVTISSILSNDPSRSVDALKKIQKVLEVGPDEGLSSAAYRDLSEHTEGLIETITLQMAHVFERPDDIVVPENFRLAKHLIQTLNAFCDHAILAESLTVDILTSLLEELTIRLLQTDNSPDNKIKDLSRFINMIILRLFATARRMSIFRCVRHRWRSLRLRC